MFVDRRKLAFINACSAARENLAINSDLDAPITRWQVSSFIEATAHRCMLKSNASIGREM